LYEFKNLEPQIDLKFCVSIMLGFEFMQTH
jgi:hypothetical protein